MRAAAGAVVDTGAVRGVDVVTGFLAAAGADPDRTAIAGNGSRLSYAELRERVLALAGRLGPCPGEIGRAHV